MKTVRHSSSAVMAALVLFGLSQKAWAYEGNYEPFNSFVDTVLTVFLTPWSVIAGPDFLGNTFIIVANLVLPGLAVLTVPYLIRAVKRRQLCASLGWGALTLLLSHVAIGAVMIMSGIQTLAPRIFYLGVRTDYYNDFPTMGALSVLLDIGALLGTLFLVGMPSIGKAWKRIQMPPAGWREALVLCFVGGTTCAWTLMIPFHVFLAIYMPNTRAQW